MERKRLFLRQMKNGFGIYVNTVVTVRKAKVNNGSLIGCELLYLRPLTLLEYYNPPAQKLNTKLNKDT